MIGQRATFGGYYAAFVGIGLATALVVAALGYFPTMRLTSGGGAAALAVGCGVSWIASCVGAVPISLALSQSRASLGSAVLAATALRFGVVLASTLCVALTRVFEPAPLLIWVALSYLTLVAAETTLALRFHRKRPTTVI